MNKKFMATLIFFVSIVFTVIFFDTNVFAETENFIQPKITVDGKDINLEGLGIFEHILTQKNKYNLNRNNEKEIINTFSKTMIPLRSVARKMDYEIKWDGENQKITLNNDKREIVVYMNKDIYELRYEEDDVYHEELLLSEKPLMFGSTTFVPIEMFDLLGYSYEVNGNNITFSK